jgi:dipeptidyl aminopeptidase/acylaminoacyl peptidase
MQLFARTREKARLRNLQGRVERALPQRPLGVPVPTGSRITHLQLSPDGRFLTVRVRATAANRAPTKYLDYLDPSGYSRVLDAREKAGEPRDRYRLGVMAVDPSVPPDSVAMRWFTLADAGAEATVPHGPYWSPDGSRAIVQFVGEHDKDLWITEVDLATLGVKVLARDHDDAWIGGPPVQSNNTGPTLLQWLPDGQLAFATERSGFSHLARIDKSGAVQPMTSGEWEVRGAELSRDGRQWLLTAGKDNASEDHLYTMPAGGGPLTRITINTGRNNGVLSPDGTRLALVRSDNTAFPDLFVRRMGAASTGAEVRVTQSGTDEWVRRKLARPQIVSITAPDGRPVYAALYRPAKPNAERAALIHVHGGGYRHFTHLGWSVYGWSGHVGLMHYFLEQGYTVLDFDYRGGAGYGRQYRTDIAYSMGTKDVDGAVAAAQWLVRNEGIDSTRIGMYGVSYGGFMTLMSMFRYPGVFAAGIARAPVTDWAHYSDGWTSRILGVPQSDTAAYRRSSPIFFAEGLRDHLLIEHGLVDDNVHFQDTARLVQRLLELEKEFDVMYYPTEPHVVETEVSRYDQSRRAAAYFQRWWLDKP